MTRQEATVALLELVAHPDGVAAALRELEVTGWPMVQCHCPVANYLRAQGAAEVEVRVPGALVDGHHVLLPSAVCRFVREFDAGEHPALDKRTCLAVEDDELEEVAAC